MAEESTGCLCGKEMILIMEDVEYRLWSCPPTGCGRLKLEDKTQGLGATWFQAERSEQG